MKIKEDIEQLLIKFAEVSDLFYKQKNSEAYNTLFSVLNDIEQVINNLKNLKNDNKNQNFDESKINSTLFNAKTAMENNDNILLADIINYELREHFENVISNL